jgi:hypothetical protein
MLSLEEFSKDSWEAPPRESVRFTRETVDEPPERLVSTGLVILSSVALYPAFRIDHPIMLVNREECFRLGLLIASALVHQSERVCVELSHPKSQLRHVWVRPDADWVERGVEQSVTGVVCHDQQFARTPWYPLPGHLAPYDLPSLRITDSLGDSPMRDEDWLTRDTLIGFGRPVCCAQMACLLIAASRGDVEEYNLYHEPKPAGVCPGSAELDLVLPGSVVYEQLLG